MASDWELLRRYAKQRDQDAFSELVRRHVDMVYAAARRRLGSGGPEAEDVVQAVFLLLSQKAGRIAETGALAGWLFRTTRYCCANVKKSGGRRKHHEREAGMQRQETAVLEEDLGPVLDEALERLGEKERQAVLARYLQGKTIAETSEMLGVSVSVTEKRLRRGVEKLRQIFGRKGFVVPAAGVAAFLTVESAKAAPAGLAASAAAVTGASSAAAVSIAKGASVMMKMALLKMSALAGAVVVAMAMIGAAIAAQGQDGKVEAVAAATRKADRVVAATAQAPAAGTVIYEAVVRDEAGKPVAGAKVRLERRQWDRRGMIVEGETVTGKDGKFLIGPVKEIHDAGFGSRELVADVPGHAWGWLEGRRKQIFDDEPMAEIRVEKAETVSGGVVDDEGKAIAGAEVGLSVRYGTRETSGSALGFDADNGRGAKTDASGRFVIVRVPADGHAYLSAKCAGYVTESGILPDGGEPPVTAGAKDVRVVMKRGGVVRVQLMKAGEAFRKSGVVVNAFRKGVAFDSARTDERGEAIFNGLAAGTYSFAASGSELEKEGLVGKDTAEVELKAGEKNQVMAECIAGRLVKGKMTGPSTGVTKLFLSVIREGAMVLEHHELLKEDGSFTLVLGPGKYMMFAQIFGGWGRIKLDGVMAKEFEIGAGAEPLEMDVKVGDLWHGRLVDDRGEGVRGYVLLTNVGRVEAREDGRFEMPTGARGELTVAWDREKKRGKLFKYGVGEGEHLIKLEPMGEIQGKLDLPAGRKVEEVKLELSINTGPAQGLSWGRTLWRSRLADDGKFVIGPVPVGQDTYVSARDPLGNGEGRVVVIGGEMQITARTPGIMGYSERFSITSGGVVDVGTLHMRGEGVEGDTRDWKCAVKGRVVTEKGEGMKGLRVWTRITNGPSAVTDLEGRFELKGLPAGELTLSTDQVGNYRPAEMKVESPGEGVEMKMTPQGWELWGKEAPELMVDSWASGEVKRLGDLRGKVVLLAIGIDSRHKETWEHLQKLQEKFGGKGLVVVAVHWHIGEENEPDRSVTKEEVATLGKKMGLAVAVDDSTRRVDADFPRNSWARGSTELVYGVRDRFGEGAIFLVDRKGILVGAVNGEEEKRVEEALGK